MTRFFVRASTSNLSLINLSLFPLSTVTQLSMPITTKHRYLLPLILIFALVIRSIGLNHYPALNPDEAALGYNAYSILTTAKDEHGHFLPLHLLSFGDSKPAGYTYLAIPFVAILGLTPLAVRLPNLIFSILSIYFIYRL